MRELLQLLIDNRARGQSLSVKNEGDTATVYLYDSIGGYWGVDPAEFVKQLAGLDVKTIDLRINSPGGDVFDARAIKTALQQHPAKVVAHIDGLAASAATFIAMGADEVEISAGAFMMIHKGWTMMVGNADELRDMAELLDKVDASIVADYRSKTDASDEQIETWMSEETWFTAEEAVANGFADRVYEGSEPTENRSRFDLSAYEHAPEALTQSPSPDASVDQMRAHLERRLSLLERVPR